MIPSNKYLTTNQKKAVKFILSGVLFLLGFWIFTNSNVQHFWQSALTEVKNLGIWGYVLFICIYNLATLCLIPGSILTMKGGCLYGLWWGSAIVLIAASLGAVGAFLLGRYFCRDWVYSLLQRYPNFQKIDQAIASKGWQIVFLTRLSPIFPFNLLNYLFGISQISLKDYILGSLGMIPGTIMYVYFGSLATDLATIEMSPPITRETEILRWLMRIIGLIATISLTVYFTHFAKQTLRNTLEKD
jgi:uncharacterized membrane protein YdjX (TVP38/TMEM64 family)